MFQLGKRNTTRKNSLPLRYPQDGGANKRTPLTLDPAYWQTQESAGCGRHALNNLFGGTYFVKDDGSTPTNIEDLKKIKQPVSLQSICRFAANQEIAKSQKDFNCLDNENYEILVLIYALNILGYSALPQNEFTKDDGAVIGYIYNLGPIKGKDIMRHWVAIRKIDTKTYRYIDSLDSTHKANGRDFPSLENVNDYVTKALHKEIPNKLQVRFTGSFVQPILALAKTTSTDCPFELNDEIQDGSGNHFFINDRKLGDKLECQSITVVNIETDIQQTITTFDSYTKVNPKTYTCDYEVAQGIVYNSIKYGISRIHFKNRVCVSLDATADVSKTTINILSSDFGKIIILKPGEEWTATPLPGSSPANSTNLELPLDNLGHFQDVWKQCKTLLSKIPTTKPGAITLKKSTDGFTIMNDSTELSTQSTIDTLKSLVLLRYKYLLQELPGKNLGTLEFFNQLESIREYHARQCIQLCLNRDGTVPTNDEILKYTLSNLEPLDRFIYTSTIQPSAFTPFEMTFIVNHMIVAMATLEKDMVTDKYANAILNPEIVKDFPSHIRLLSRYIHTLNPANAANVRHFYPQSLLMNYAYFFPFVLYHSGKPPSK
jgi:hypothetical protein